MSQNQVISSDSGNEEEHSSQEFVWGEGLSLAVSATKMSVSVEVDVLKAEHYSSNDIIEFLRQNNIEESLIKEDTIKKIFDNLTFNRTVTVAKGIQPINGEDGYVDWVIDLSILDGARLVEKKGRVDYKEQHHILQIGADELMARLVEPTDGAYGKDVYGAEIPPTAGKPAKFSPGKGVRIDETGLELYSEIAGAVCREGDKIGISPIYQVQGDVSFKTGNVEYDESVVISGDIMTDFKVAAGQDLHVNGLVEGAVVEAKGNMILNGGVQGDDKAIIRAGGDITVKFVNNARLEANGNIYVKGSVIQSILKAKGSIILDEQKGVIQGGHTIAEKEIVATVIGSEIGVKTIVELGQELAKMKITISDNEQKIETLTANYKKLKQAADALNKLSDLGKLQPEQAELRLKIIRSGLQMQSQIKQIVTENKHIQDEMDVARKDQVGIGARDMVWPGTVVIIMGNKVMVRAKSSKILYRFVNNEVSEFAFIAREEKKKASEKKKQSEKTEADPGTGEEASE